MLTISPQFSNFGWLLDDPISHEQFDNNYYFSRENPPTSDSIDLHSPSSQAKNGDFTSFCDGLVQQGDVGKTVKKLNHNASERDRRKKINTMYSTLRSLLPPEEQSRKLSIPNTISRVLKYIPDLENEVAQLVHKKESFMSKITRQEVSNEAHENLKDQKKIKTTQFSSAAISANQISNKEIIIQISAPKVGKNTVTEALMILEQEGYLLLSASSTDSPHGRVFCNFHLQIQEGQLLNAEMLKEKLWSIYGKAGEIILT